VKRRVATIAITTGLLTVSGALFADAEAATPMIERDSSGCVVLLGDTAHPLYLCLFSR
jgi:hypothetical protein